MVSDKTYDTRLTGKLQDIGGYSYVDDPLDLIVDIAVEMVDDGKCHTRKDTTPVNVPEPVTARKVARQCAYEETVEELRARLATFMGQSVAIDWDRVGVLPSHALE
jgi:hypothetical protein